MMSRPPQLAGKVGLELEQGKVGRKLSRELKGQFCPTSAQRVHRKKRVLLLSFPGPESFTFFVLHQQLNTQTLVPRL